MRSPVMSSHGEQPDLQEQPQVLKISFARHSILETLSGNKIANTDDLIIAVKEGLFLSGFHEISDRTVNRALAHLLKLGYVAKQDSCHYQITDFGAKLYQLGILELNEEDEG